MSACNSGKLVGNIVSDIEIAHPKGGVSVTTFRIQPQDAKEGASAIPVTAFNGVGERIKRMNNKGDLISVDTHTFYNTWEKDDKHFGNIQVVVDYSYTLRLGTESKKQRSESNEVTAVTK